MDMNYLSELESAFQKKYLEDLNDFREYLKLDFNSELLSDDFHEALFKLIFGPDLERYSPLRYYWLKTVEDFFYIIELHYDLDDQNLTDEDDDYSEEECLDEIRESWLKSLFADGFSEMLDEGLSVTDASMAMVSLMESQILSFYYVHISSDDVTGETAFLYNSNPELGDFNNRIYLSDHFYAVEFENESELFPSIPISDVDYDRKVIGVEINAETEFFKFDTSRSLVHLEHRNIPVIGGSDSGSEKAASVAEWLEGFIKTEKIDSNVLNSIHTIILSDDHADFETEPKLPGVLYLNSSVDAENFLQGISQLVANNFVSILEGEIEDEIELLFSNPWTKQKDSLPALVGHFIANQVFLNLNSKQSDKVTLSAAETISKALKKVKLSKISSSFLKSIL